MKRARVSYPLIALVPIALLLSACSTMSGTAAGSSPGGMMSSAMSSGHDMMHDDEQSDDSLSAADIMFAQMMIPHHEQAVEISTLAVTRAADPFIVALAATIKSAQQPEIDQMKSWLTAAGLPVMDRDEMGHMGHGMPGIVTDEQMLELAAATGATFDRLFATYMIAHHEGAIEMAKQVVDSANPQVAALAGAIISSQTAEIAQMQEFLANQR